MKKNLLLYIAALAALTSCYQPEVQASMPSVRITDTAASVPIIKISGSTTISPIIEKITTQLSKSNSYQVEIVAKGSSDGMDDLFKGKADIAMSSHLISPKAKAEFRTSNMEYVEFLLAGDALVFVVNVQNPIKSLTQEQLVAIFKGKVSNWKQVGGPDAAINIISRDSLSGTYSFMKAELLENEPLHAKAKLVASNDSLFTTVASDRFAIGYTSFSNLDYSVEPLNVSFDFGKTYISPRVETVNNLTYRFFRGLYLYYKPESYEKIKSLMAVVKADTVQKMLKKNGYIPINHHLITRK